MSLNRIKNIGKLMSGGKSSGLVAQVEGGSVDLKGKNSDGSQIVKQQQKLTQQQVDKQMEEKFKKREKYYVTEGPMLFLSMMLYQKGSLNYNQMWKYYLRDEEAVKQNIFRSKNHLKFRVLRKMIEDGRLEKIPYDKQLKVFHGWRLNQQRALKNVHPDILLTKLNPVPEIKRMNQQDVIYRQQLLQTEDIQTN